MSYHSFDSPTVFITWQAVLLPRLRFNDYDLNSLWCCTKGLQGLICSTVENVAVWLRPSTQPSGDPVYLSFFSKLTRLRAITVQLAEDGVTSDAMPLACFFTSFPNFLPPLTMVVTPVMGTRFFHALANLNWKEFKGLKLKFIGLDLDYWEYHYGEHQDEYEQALVAILNAGDDSEQPFPLALLAFTCLPQIIYHGITKSDTSVTPAQQAWLFEHWFPLITVVDFEELPDRHSVEATIQCKRYQQQIYDSCINVSAVKNSIVPCPTALRTFSYEKENIHDSTLNSIFTFSGTYLTTIHLSIYLPSVPLSAVVLPATLTTFDLTVLDDPAPGGNDFPGIITLIAGLPARLTTLKCDLDVVEGGQDQDGDMWTAAVVAKLPRGLRTLNVIPFSGDIESWEYLPPCLTEFNCGNSRYVPTTNYQKLSPLIKELYISLMSADMQWVSVGALHELIPLQHFHSLRTLHITLKGIMVITRAISLPPTVENLELVLNRHSVNTDQLSHITWPTSMRALSVRVHGSMMGGSTVQPRTWQPWSGPLRSLRFWYPCFNFFPDLVTHPVRYLTLDGSDPTNYLSTEVARIPAWVPTTVYSNGEILRYGAAQGVH